MYENIASKIKGLATGTFLVETILSVIAAVAIMATDEDMILFGLLVLIIGPLVAWLSTLVLYGFGELIEKVCEIARNTAPAKSETTSEANNQTSTDAAASTSAPASQATPIKHYKCPKCGTHVTDEMPTCPTCGQQFAWQKSH